MLALNVCHWLPVGLTGNGVRWTGFVPYSYLQSKW